MNPLKLDLKSANNDYHEISNAKEYNEKYSVKVSNENRLKRKKEAGRKGNEVTEYYLSLSESERNRFAQSYMLFTRNKEFLILKKPASFFDAGFSLLK